MIYFNSDYLEGSHPALMAKLNETNMVQTVGYGEDEYCAAVRVKIQNACQAPEADVHFLVGGTQTNLVAITAFLASYEAVIAPHTGHVNTHETGAIEATGHKVIAMPGTDGKLTPAAIADADALHCDTPGVYDEHMVLPRMVYVSDATEPGTVYPKAELPSLLHI